jgi:hypothetical protein
MVMIKEEPLVFILFSLDSLDASALLVARKPVCLGISFFIAWIYFK